MTMGICLQANTSQKYVFSMLTLLT